MMEARSAWDKKAAEAENRRKRQQYILDNIANIKRQIEYAENRTSENKAKLSKLLTTQETETVNIQQHYEQQAQKDAMIQVFLNERQRLQDEIDSKTAA